MHAFVSKNTIVSIWEPNDEEREAIAKGANIMLLQYGKNMAPTLLSISDQKELEDDARAYRLLQGIYAPPKAS